MKQKTINAKWTAIDKAIAYAQLERFGAVYVDGSGRPIADDSIIEMLIETEKTK